METIKWYESLVGDASENAVAMKAGVNQRTLNRQIKRGRLGPEVVVAIAQAYGYDVLDALVIAELITPEQIEAHGIRAALKAASDRELADEVWGRMAEGRGPVEFGGADGPVAPTPLRAVSDEGETLAASSADIDAEVEAQQNEP